MQKIWMRKAQSFSEAQDQDLDYYLKMTPQERIGNMLELFNKHSVRYCIVGPFALAFYARPRYTKDFDIDLHQFLLAFKTAPPLKLHFPM